MIIYNRNNVYYLLISVIDIVFIIELEWVKIKLFISSSLIKYEIKVHSKNKR